MNYIIVNRADVDSRNFEALLTTEGLMPNPFGMEIFDWYDIEARDAYLANGGSVQVSSFPALSVFVPEYEYETVPEVGDPYMTTVSEHYENFNPGEKDKFFARVTELATAIPTHDFTPVSDFADWVVEMGLQ